MNSSWHIEIIHIGLSFCIFCNPVCKTEKETLMYRTEFWTLWEKARVGCFKSTASKHVYYLGWNRSPAQVGCMRQVLGPGALGWSRGIRWRGRWEGGSGWGIHVNPWLIHVNVWQKPLQYCKVISLQIIKKKEFIIHNYLIKVVTWSKTKSFKFQLYSFWDCLNFTPHWKKVNCHHIHQVLEEINKQESILGNSM